MSNAKTRIMYLEGKSEGLRHEIVESTAAATWQEFADRTSLRADSILTELDDQEFVDGMERIREHALAPSTAGPVTQSIDLFAFQKIASEHPEVMQ